MDCIVLAGGLGTRLASVVSDRPKCMADVNGRPFLDHLLEEIETQGIVDNVVLALGYRSEQVIDWLRNKAFLFKTSWVIEKEQKGTGGAIRFALQKTRSEKVLVVNGDTLFRIDWQDMIQSVNPESELFIALRKVENAHRYGAVSLDEAGQITHFAEKSEDHTAGYINAGIYIMDRRLFDQFSLEEPFSFEKDIMPGICERGKMYGKVYDDYFIDIGVPDDYSKFIEDSQ